MFPRILPALLAILVCGSSAQAGMILGRAADADVIRGSQSGASVMVGWLASQQDEGDDAVFLQDIKDSFAAVPTPSSGSVANCAILIDLVAARSLPRLSWQVSIGNSSLPPLPLLDGLLKPS